MSRPRIVVDENVPMALEAFGSLGVVELVAGRKIAPSLLREADALVVRSITKVNPALLSGSRIRAVGTCTIGTDHLDIPWLETQGIAWSSAPGCNARSVGEHVLSSLCHLHRSRRLDLSKPMVLGIVGMGNTGSALAAIASALGWTVLACDPPRANREGREGFLPLSVLIEQCDVLSFHVPLVRKGIDPTWRLVGAEALSKLKAGAVLVNAARGPVLDPYELVQLRALRPDLSICLDVFDPEPSFPVSMTAVADLLSPHVAGYSLEGKIEGTRRIRNWLGSLWNEVPWVPGDVEPLVLPWPKGGGDPWDQLAQMILAVHDPLADDRRMRDIARLDDNARALAFDRLRKEYPVRREWAGVQWDGACSKPSDTSLVRAHAAGFVLQ